MSKVTIQASQYSPPQTYEMKPAVADFSSIEKLGIQLGEAKFSEKRFRQLLKKAVDGVEKHNAEMNKGITTLVKPSHPQSTEIRQTSVQEALLDLAGIISTGLEQKDQNEFQALMSTMRKDGNYFYVQSLVTGGFVELKDISSGKAVLLST